MNPIKTEIRHCLFKCFIIILLFILYLPFDETVESQKIWTLEECIKYALDNNIQLKRQEIQTEISKNNYNQSKYNILPNIQAGASNNWGFGLYINPYTNQLTDIPVLSDNFYLSGSVVVFNGLQQLHSIQQNLYLLDKSLQDYEVAKNDITMQIATVYLQILFGEENLLATQQQVDFSHQQTEKMLKLFEVGSKSKSDLLVMQASEANDKYNNVTAKNNLNISYLTLTQLLELKSSDGFTIYNPDSLTIDAVKSPKSVEDIYKTAIDKLPQIKSAEFDLLNNEKGLDIARGQLSPVLSLSGNFTSGYTNELKQVNVRQIGQTMDTIGYVNGNHAAPVTTPINLSSYTTSDYPFSSQLKNNEYKSISFNLSIPIFNHFQTRTNISNARLRLADSQYVLEQTKKSIYKDIQSAYADAIGALENYKSASESVIANSEVLKYSQQKYDVGMMSAEDYNLAKTNLVRAKTNLMQAKYQYIFKVKILEFYQGLPITL